MREWQLSSQEWDTLRSLLDVKEARPKRGRPRSDQRPLAEICLLRHYKSLSPVYRSFGWHQLPSEYESLAATANRRFAEWVPTGQWMTFWDALMELRHGKPKVPRRPRSRATLLPSEMIVGELQRGYAYFNSRFFGASLPDKLMIMLEPAGGRTRGYYCGRHWRKGSEELGHIAICTSILGTDAAAVFEVLLHEIVHLRNSEVGISDCHSVNQYHNQHFRDVAVLVGLECCGRHPQYGYGRTRLAERGRRAIADLNLDDDVFRWNVRGPKTR